LTTEKVATLDVATLKFLLESQNSFQSCRKLELVLSSKFCIKFLESRKYFISNHAILN